MAHFEPLLDTLLQLAAANPSVKIVIAYTRRVRSREEPIFTRLVQHFSLEVGLPPLSTLLPLLPHHRFRLMAARRPNRPSTPQRYWTR